MEKKVDTVRKNKLKGGIELFICAMIWGSAFIAQKIALGYVESFTLNCVRMTLASLALLPVVFFRRRRAVRKGEVYPLKKSVFAGLLCGVTLFVAANAQQAAIKLSTPGKVSFITAFYVVLVPIIGLVFGRKVRFNVWIGAVLSIAGLYLLCVVDSMTVSAGDFLALACALMFAVQITLIGHYGKGTDPIALSMAQFAVAGVLSAPPMLIFETPGIAAIESALIPILYAGLLSCGVGYTLQAVGQRETEPSVASIIVSLEAVFALVSEMIWYKRVPGRNELIGCAIMLCAIVVSQLEFHHRAAKHAPKV